MIKNGRRQLQKYQSGGKYNQQYVTDKIVKRAAERSGLTLYSGLGRPDYYLCMHWPSDVGVGEEHWWLEVFGYTVELYPAATVLYIYGPRRPESANYSQSRIALAGLQQRQVDRIAHLLINGVYQILQRNEFRDSIAML
jgi:hypothetical protein